MGNLNLTVEERNLVERIAREREGVTYRLGFYASVLVPMTLFAGYGFVMQDFLAETIAYGGLFAFLLWRISSELQRIDIFKSAMRKVVDHEQQEAR